MNQRLDPVRADWVAVRQRGDPEPARADLHVRRLVRARDRQATYRSIVSDRPILERSEREGLCDLFAELGPDAPTLCTGWTTSDLAVHLIMCEARPQAWLGVPVGNRGPALRRYFDRMMDKERAGGWPRLVARVRRGPAYGPTANQ